MLSEDLNMSDRGSWNALLSHLASGAGCERSDQRIRTCLTRQNCGCEISREGETSAGQNSSSGGMSYAARRKGDRLCVQGVEIPLPDDTECASLSGATPSGFPKRTLGALPYPDSLREKHTTLVNITPRTIVYPIRICCSDHWLKWASLASHSASLPQPTFRRPPMVCPDALSGHLCHGFQRTLLNLGLLWWSKSY